jgi:glycosyltransferase involved in cell wall biosynthesis
VPNSKHPSVSVIIPTYNRAGLVTRAIDSVLAQTYPHFEVIVVDDGSTDNTREVLNEGYGDRIRYVHQTNKGSAAARNAGIAASSCDLVAFLDSDDYWLPRKLEVQVPLMANEGVVLSFTNWWDGKDSSGRDYFSQIGLSFGSDPTILDCPLRTLVRKGGSGVLTSVTLCRKSIIRRVGGFDERMGIYEDTRMWLRLSFEGKFAVTSEALVVWVVEAPGGRLTQPENLSYQREAARHSFEVFIEAYARTGDCPADVQRALRHLIAYSLVSQSKCYAIDRNYRMARRKALESFVFFPKGESLLKALAGLFFPRAFRLLARRRRDREES